MTVPGNLSSPLLATAAEAAAAGAVATKSLRFNSGDSAKLSRTPSSAGNRKTFTFSCWLKRTKLARETIFSAGSAVSTSFAIEFNGSNKLDIYDYNSSFTWRLQSTAVYRDPASFFHLVLSVDTTQATASNRVKAYINGSQITDFDTSSYPSQNHDSFINNNVLHTVGCYQNDTFFSNTLLTDIYFIDGSALDPTSFGAHDANGVWQAAAYSGTFGTNGFHLAFEDTSSVAALGTDSSGNNNTFTVNNITLNKASISSSTITNVAAGNAWNQSKNWSSLVSGPSQGYASGNPITKGFDGSNSTLANASSAGGTMTFSAALGTGTFNVEMRFGNDQLYNGTTIDGVAPTSTSVANTIGHWTGLTSFNVMTMNSTGLANNARCCWNWIKVNGKFLVDSGNSGDPGGGPPDLTIANTTNFDQLAVHDLVQTNVSITAIDSSTSKISVSGGSWEGSDGTGTSGGDTTVSTVAVTTGDSFFDVPTNGTQSDTGAGGEVSGNYCIFNALKKGNDVTLSNGNLQAACTSSSKDGVFGTIGVSSGKWYWEVQLTSSDSNTNAAIGIATSVLSPDAGSPTSAGAYFYSSFNGNKWLNSADSSYGASYGTGDVIGVALDLDNDTLTFYKNGSTQGDATTSLPSGTYFPYVGDGANNSAQTVVANWGQRSFSYSAPSNHKALCTTNLPTPTIADGSAYFEAKLWTGNSPSTQTITGFKFSPDFVWIKNRSSARNHAVLDIVRGGDKVLKSNSNDAEDTASNFITSFTSDGFAIGNDSSINGSSNAIVGWAWDAGSSTASNTDGSITSSVRANASAGFSIVTYTGTGASGATVGHGLGAAPSFIIIKQRIAGPGTDLYNWNSYHSSLGATKYIALNTTDAAGTAPLFNDTSPTNSVFSLGSSSGTYNNVNNASGVTYVAYCFASVAGYSAIGSYTGNGSTDGPFVFTGFRPRYILIKCASTAESWIVHDTARDISNVSDTELLPNTNGAEYTYTRLDVLSNGFKARTTEAASNTSGSTYVYYAVAENPFQANGGLAR